jgi:hypothetical protein
LERGVAADEHLEAANEPGTLARKCSVVNRLVFECGVAVRMATVVKTVVKADFNGSDRATKLAFRLVKRVELRGLEPLTPTLPV